MAALLMVTGCVDPKPKQSKGTAHYMYGLSHLKQQQYTDALKEFMLAVEQDPQRPDFYNALAQAYQYKKAYPEAEKSYLKALSLSKNNPEYQNNLAALYLDMKRWDDAITYFRQAANNLLFGTPEVASTGVGYAYFQKSNYLDAIAAYQEAIQKNINYPVAHLRLGEAYYALEKWDLAVAAYEKAIEVAPNYVDAHYKLGLAYMKVGEQAKAKNAFAEVLQLAPTTEVGKLAKGYLELLD
jgi:Tfp pilus assembly protein PilF